MLGFMDTLYLLFIIFGPQKTISSKILERTINSILSPFLENDFDVEKKSRKPLYRNKKSILNMPFRAESYYPACNF